MAKKINVRLTAFILWALLFIGTLYASDESGRPNIILIMVDDVSFTDTSPYGSEIFTPNIQNLADEGLLFTNYHAAATCSPTRAMLLTGVDSHRNGVPSIPESIPDEQLGKPGYEGYLNDNVVTIATQLRDAGYHTYMTGKWHVGSEEDQLPSLRGFERTVTMLDTGADNWEKKPYSPMNEKANWYKDGKVIDLPEDFYSSDFYIDHAIDFIESNRLDGRPFFSYVAYQANHIPVQAPQEFIDNYMGVYNDGWEALRQSRYENALARGVLPSTTELRSIDMKDWESLSDEEKRYNSKKMAVYGGMLEAMDYHTGRLIDYLKETNQYDNTVFIFTADNGPEYTDMFEKESPITNLWLKSTGYNRDYETLGLKGSLMNIGHDWAKAVSSPLDKYKFWAGEGGLRVPLIISGKGISEKGIKTDAFAYVTDLASTILDFAEMDPHDGHYKGREVEPMTGKSLVPLVRGKVDSVYGENEPVGYEGAGNSALFLGDYKIVRNKEPEGDTLWHLYDITTDPGETNDLKDQMPELLEKMVAYYADYEEEANLLPFDPDYTEHGQMTKLSMRVQLKKLFKYLSPYLLGLLATVTAIIAALKVRKKRKLILQED